MDWPISSPKQLTDLVDYQPDSVVSRVILRTHSGTLTLFAFAEGQGLSEHTNPNDAVVIVLEGISQVVVGGVQHVVREGGALHLPPSVPHELVGGDRFKMLLLLLKKPREV